MEERVISNINSEIGKDIKQLKRASTLVEAYKTRILEISNKLKYDNEQKRSTFRGVFEAQQLATKSIEFQIEKLYQFNGSMETLLVEYNQVFNKTKADLNCYHKLENTLHYLRIMQDIREISDNLINVINEKDEEKLVNVYLTLYEEKDYENSIIGRLNNQDAHFLKSYAIRTAIYWHTLITDRLLGELDTMLKSIRWGQQDEEVLTLSPNKRADSLARAQILAEYLFLIKSPDENHEVRKTITPTIICQPINIVTNTLLTPFRQRFMYHFIGTRQTNRLDKPEWYFTQILLWSKSMHLFVGKTFQPAALKAGRLDYNIRLEFLRGLVQLAIEKLSMDIEEISGNESLFAHLLDETLSFEVELRQHFGYPSSFPSAITVLTQPVYLLKWISLEERFCAQQMDYILLDEDSWMLLDINFFEEALKIPKCADQFMCLLNSIKCRYYPLIQPGHQLQFLKLQLELIDNFRTRLVQLHSEGSVRSILILNAINYVTMVLREWGENVHYLHLHAALIGTDNEMGSVFEDVISGFDHWKSQLIKKLATNALDEFECASISYRRENWSTISEEVVKGTRMISLSLCEILQVLTPIINDWDRYLSANIFHITLRYLAKLIDVYLFENMIMVTKFSSGGAAQLKFDVTQSFFTLFGHYCTRPELYFQKLQDSSTLLNAARGTALLLHKVLKSDGPEQEKVAALKELEIRKFKSKTCIEVLERRTDLKLF